jgi:hypothetical protein
MSSARAVRYRRLALAEQDKANADLLLKGSYRLEPLDRHNHQRRRT